MTEQFVDPIRTALDIQSAIEGSIEYVFGTCINYNADVAHCIDESDDDEEEEDTKQGDSADGTDQKLLTFDNDLYHSIFDDFIVKTSNIAPNYAASPPRNFNLQHSINCDIPIVFGGKLVMVSIGLFEMSLHDALIELMTTKHGSRFLTFENIGISQDIFNAYKSKSFMQYLFDHRSEESPFGHISTLTTRVDPDVRRARHVDISMYSQVMVQTTKRIEKLWSENMFPKKVKAVPYRMNLYDEDGMFLPHKDTPSDQLVGTFLIGLGADEGRVLPKRKSERIHFKKPHDHFRIPGDGFNWDCEQSGWLAFYSDVIHEVLPCPGSGIRGTLAFKIFAVTEEDGALTADKSDDITTSSAPEPKRAKNAEEEDDDQALMITHPIISSTSIEESSPAPSPSLTAAVKREEENLVMLERLSNVQRPFGFLLSHQYSMDFSSAKGIDSLLIDLLRRIPDADVIIIPAVTFVDGYFDHDASNTGSRTTKVAPFTSGHVNTILGRKLTPTDKASIIACNRFVMDDRLVPMAAFRFNKLQGVWKNEEQESAEYTGNESLPGSEHSIYLNAAVIVLDKRLQE